VSCARVVHKTVKGKYRAAHKKVVSNFSKERMGRINFLNPQKNQESPSSRRMSLFLCQIASRAYEIFMNRSGLPDGHFDMFFGEVTPAPEQERSLA
jgi:hypothetical protein